ncbi:PQQ-dependent sugar dehydrogenase [Bacillus sp. SG-1]|uniref:PQQ-dependent sugar dehydrogenase n=1 Tax=Bacillus sp. SG-1 TaxID=161544 RepID=UPI00030AC0EB|nr:hypothetical protein [Bacillus sp. SG-1]
MNGYIPNRMLEKEYVWEFVNLYLYGHLYEQNPYPELAGQLVDMYQKQAAQLEIIKNITLFQGGLRNLPQLDIQYQSFEETVDELYLREYQLLQEYFSYPAYFLPGASSDQNFRTLIAGQTEQVDLLIQLKDSLKKEKKKKEKEYTLQDGYKLEKVASGLTYPTCITFDEDGSIYIAESGYAYGSPPGEGRILKVPPEGKGNVFAKGFKGPLTGITWADGYLYAAEGAIAGYPGAGCGRIIRVSPDGSRKVIVDGLKTCGDHFTGDVIMGPDKKLYFTVGTATNSGVVGTDNKRWLKMHPTFHETPSRNYTLNGRNFISSNPLSEKDDLAVTGAFKPFGEAAQDGEVLQGELMANGVLYSCSPDGSNLQMIADGFRNPFGLVFSPFNGKLYLSDNGADARGSRQVYGDWDNLWEVTSAGWHGWPDFYSGLPVTLEHFHVKDKPKPAFLLKQHPPLASQPVVRFSPHTASHKFDFSTSPQFGYEGEIFLGQFGGGGAGSYGESPGYKVVRVDVKTGQIRDFFVNHKGEKSEKGPLRPIQAKFGRDGRHLYVVDFGRMDQKDPKPKTGSLWRIVKG